MQCPVPLPQHIAMNELATPWRYSTRAGRVRLCAGGGGGGGVRVRFQNYSAIVFCKRAQNAAYRFALELTRVELPN